MGGANSGVWSGPRLRRFLTVTGRQRSHCFCGWTSWSWRTGGSRRGSASLSSGLSRSSRNSSLPPSQDPPSAPPRPRTPASGRRPGGQPGHEGRNRRLLPLEQLDELVEHWPVRCGRCDHPFDEQETRTFAATTRGLALASPRSALSQFQQTATIAAEADLDSDRGFLQVHKPELRADRQIRASSASSHHAPAMRAGA